MDDLELIKSRINIVDLISEYLPLKKAGVNFKTNCPFHQEHTPSFMVSPERGIWHCFGCFPPGELVKTPFGYHRIEEIDKNHWVVSGKGNIQKVTEVMKHEYQGDLVKVRVRKLGGIVRLTADHNVFVIKGAPYTTKYKNFSKRYKKYLQLRVSDPGGYCEKVSQYFPLKTIQAGELVVGDLLVYPINRVEKDVLSIKLSDYLTKATRLGPVPRKLPEEIEVNEQFLRLIGYWIAEGSNHRAYIRFSLGSHEEGFAAEIVGLVKQLFNLEASLHRRLDLSKTGFEVTICHSQLANIFENLCGKGAAQKHIPFIFQELPTQKQKWLLEAILKGDGTTFLANKSKKLHKSITTTAKVLKEQILDLLLRLNIFPTISVHKATIDKDNVNHKESYYISWSEEANQKYNLSYYLPDGSEFWVLPITNLNKESYVGPVHNFSVANDHSYIATNFAVANCDKGGDIFKFIMEKEGLDFKEALELLAQKANVVLKTKPGKEKNSNDRLYEVNSKAAQFFHYLLVEHPLGKNPLEYLQKRGLSLETIKTFQIGYAPKSWETLASFLKKRGFSGGELIASGLAVPSKRGGYDRFRGRVMFPLIDTRNRYVGFSGRVLDKSEPKYINTPQTPVFDKGRFLFGLNLTKTDIREQKSAILVEGEMDMLMSYQAGVKNVVASKGTALTQAQVDALQKLTDTLSLCFDTDLAGDEAVRRGIEIAESSGMNIQVIKLEGGKDPGEICLKDPEIWKIAANNAIPIYDYYLSSVAKRLDLKSPFGKRAAFNELIPIWKKIPDPMTREHYIEKLAALLKVKDEIVRKELSKPTPNVTQIAQVKEAPEKDGIESVPDRRKLLEDYLIALLFHIPSDHTYVPSFPETLLTQEHLRQVYVLLVLFLDSISFKGRSFKITEFVKGVPPELIPAVDRLYLISLDEKLTTAQSWQKEVDSCIAELKKMLIKSSLEKLSLEIKNAQEFDKMEIMDVLNKRFRDLSVKLKNL